MTQKTDETVTIGVGPSMNPQAAVIDVRERDAAALKEFRKFFENPSYQNRVEKVRSLVDNFFPSRKGLYVNHRSNRGKPFTVIKVDDATWPRVSRKRADELYYEPLKALDVTPIYSVKTRSYLFRVF